MSLLLTKVSIGLAIVSIPGILYAQNSGHFFIPDVQKIRPVLDNYHLSGTFDCLMGNARTRTIFRLEIWKSGDRMRVDVTTLDGSNDKSQVGQREIICKNCSKEMRGLTTTQGAKFVTPVFFTNSNNLTSSYLFDWTKIGLINAGLAQYRTTPWDYSLKLFTSKTSDHFETPIYKENGTRSSILLPRKNHEGHIAMEIDANYDNNPTKITYTRLAKDSMKTVFLVDTSIDYLQHRVGGKMFSFPSRIQYRRESEGATVVEEILEFQKTEFGITIPDQVFDLEGFGLIEGTPIAIYEGQKILEQPTWRNGKIDYGISVAEQISDPTLAKPIPDITPSSFWSHSWPYVVGAAVLAAVGFVLLRRMKKSPA